jgi:hypothetical protein
MLIFNADDINGLVERFEPGQLRHEISNARRKLAGEYDYRWQLFYEDYIKSCQLAIAIQWIPRPKDSPQYRESIESIKGRIDLVDYIGQYVTLHKSGNKFNGLCPFHSDKNSPSFFVYPGSGWHCFGCQKSGDLIDFVREYKNMDIKQAIEELSR